MSWRDQYKPKDYKENVALKASENVTLNALKNVLPGLNLDNLW